VTTTAAQAARARLYGRHCEACAQGLPHPKPVKPRTAELIAWLARDRTPAQTAQTAQSSTTAKELIP
jgi:hypothetical protein